MKYWYVCCLAPTTIEQLSLSYEWLVLERFPNLTQVSVPNISYRVVQSPDKLLPNKIAIYKKPSNISWSLLQVWKVGIVARNHDNRYH